MPARLWSILRLGLVYPAVFLLFFVIGVYWTFPYDHLKDFIIQEAERSGQVQLEIGSLSPSWVTGVHAEDVSVALTPTDEDERPRELRLSSASARISLWSLLFGTQRVSYDVDFDGGGTADGVYATGSAATEVTAHLDQVDIRRLGPLRQSSGIPMAGRIEGDVDLTIAEDPAETEGDVDLIIRSLTVADGRTPIVIPRAMPGGGGLTLEEMRLGDLELQMTAEEGIARLTRLHADGPDAAIEGRGSVRLLRPPVRSTMDAMVMLDFKEDYRTSTPRMEALFDLLNNNPMVRPARTPEEAFQWRVQGSFAGNVRVVPAGNQQME